ncbi:MAG: TfoX/Sxy family protein [Planctomycetes bacterium]|nr:TfoX/Sxy family protein [Planctomycetota bacterium]
MLEQFRELGEVSSRKMFGGAGVYFEGKCFALVDDDELYLKVDDGNRPRFEKADSHAFEPWAGHVMNGYWAVPAEVLEDPARLAEWSQHPISIAGKKKPKKTKGKKK